MEILFNSCKDGNLANLKTICDKLKTIKRSNAVNSNANTSISTDFLHKPDEHGMLALDLTVIRDKFDCCKYLFETFNLNPLELNHSGNSAFSLSIEYAKTNILKYFIENRKKYQPSKTLEDFLTTIKCNSLDQCPFQCAVESPHPDAEKILLLLISYMKMTFPLRKSLFIGAVRIRNTILIECILNYEDENKFKEDERKDLINMGFNADHNYMKRSISSEANTTPLIYAINKNDRQLITFLLCEEDTDINLLNRPISDQSPLHAAICHNDLETVMVLIEKGASKNVPVKGVFPLILTLNKRTKYLNNLDTQEAKENFMIIELLATSPVDVHLCGSTGTCAFDYAVENQMTDVIEHFCSVQGDLYNKKNKMAKVPIDYASDMEYKKLIHEKFPPV